jgi:hypothetical protein
MHLKCNPKLSELRGQYTGTAVVPLISHFHPGMWNW